MKKISEKNIVNFLYEVGMLKRRKHEGYMLAGVPSYELPSIAEHSHRAAIIGYILAILEGYEDPYKVVTMCVFHDIEETRIPDINKVANRYLRGFDKDRLLKEQLDERLGEIGKEIRKLRENVNYSSEDKAGIIAKDADYLEQAITAKELVERGYKAAEDWIINVGKALRTESAMRLWKEMQRVASYEWWNGLKKIDTFNKFFNLF